MAGNSQVHLPLSLGIAQFRCRLFRLCTPLEYGLSVERGETDGEILLFGARLGRHLLDRFELIARD